MEHYEKKISFLGENIQTIRKHRGMKQQELADKIGINMQSLSKIERGVNYPTFDTLEKIMDVLGVTPNELLSGEWKYIDHTEPCLLDTSLLHNEIVLFGIHKNCVRSIIQRIPGMLTHKNSLIPNYSG